MLLFYQINHDYTFHLTLTTSIITQMIENQEELRSALQMNREQKELLKQLEKEQTSGRDDPLCDTNEQLLTQVLIKYNWQINWLQFLIFSY